MKPASNAGVQPAYAEAMDEEDKKKEAAEAAEDAAREAEALLKR